MFLHWTWDGQSNSVVETVLHYLPLLVFSVDDSFKDCQALLLTYQKLQLSKYNTGHVIVVGGCGFRGNVLLPYGRRFDPSLPHSAWARYWTPIAPDSHAILIKSAAHMNVCVNDGSGVRAVFHKPEGWQFDPGLPHSEYWTQNCPFSSRKVLHIDALYECLCDCKTVL